jgi:hypothetical protein
MKSLIRQIKLNRLIDQFATVTKMQFGKGAEVSVLDAIENKCGVKLPSDFRYFYQKLDGYLEDMDMDGCHFSLWSTRRMLADKDASKMTASENETFIDLPFGDFLIESHRYVLRFDPKKRFLGVFTMDDQVARDFSEFLEKFMSDRQALYLVSC